MDINQLVDNQMKQLLYIFETLGEINADTYVELAKIILSKIPNDNCLCPKLTQE